MSNLTVFPKQIRPLGGAVVRGTFARAATQIGKWVIVDNTAGADVADAGSSAGVKGQVGMVIAGSNGSKDGSIAAGEAITVQFFGPVFLGSNVGLAYGTRYLIGLAGATSSTSVGFDRAVGYAESDTVLFINPDVAQPAS